MPILAHRKLNQAQQRREAAVFGLNEVVKQWNRAEVNHCIPFRYECSGRGIEVIRFHDGSFEVITGASLKGILAAIERRLG